MNKKNNREHLFTHIWIYITLFFSVVSCIQSHNANNTSNEAKKIAEESNKISKDANKISADALNETKKANKIQEEANQINLNSASVERADKIFAEIYDNWKNQEIMNILKKRDWIVNNVNDLTTFIDIFEWIWWQYCCWSMTQFDIRLYFWKSLENICRNKNIAEIFWWKKNGLAILCNKFTVESEFWKYLKWENIDKCNFR